MIIFCIGYNSDFNPCIYDRIQFSIRAEKVNVTVKFWWTMDDIISE